MGIRLAIFDFILNFGHSWPISCRFKTANQVGHAFFQYS